MEEVCLADIMKELEDKSPPGLMETWDRSGLQVGDPSSPVKKILIALDPSQKVVEEALQQNAQLILTHHPLLLKPLDKIDVSTPRGKLVKLLLSGGVALYSLHTNLDKLTGGVNDRLAALLGLCDVMPLAGGEPQVKIVVTVPKSHANEVAAAMAKAGAGKIGNYSGCAFFGEGEGRFVPGEGAKPAIGAVGTLERVEETRVEVTAEKHLAGRVASAARAAHPYEEPVVDVYPVENKSNTALGRVGKLPSPLTLEDFSRSAMRALNAPGVRYVGEPGRLVRRVAVVGGSGSDYWPLAKAKGADALVTGDVKYHTALDALGAGISLVDVGHGPSERCSADCIATLLAHLAEAGKIEIAYSGSLAEDPFIFIKN